MVKKILIGVVVVILGFVLVVATRPAEFRIARSITIDAPPDVAFALVDDFHEWQKWSPYEKIDPAMKKTFTGAARGQGAAYAWAGSDKVGEGRMTIEQSRAASLISIKLEFVKPFTATNTATFTFSGGPRTTEVTWAMDGKNNFVAKAACMFMDMDKLVGADFERGLSALKSQAEANAKANATL
jgi:hypothetical protein